MNLSSVQIKKVKNSGFKINEIIENGRPIIKSIEKGPLNIWLIIGDNFKHEYQTAFLINGYYKMHKKYKSLTGAMSRNKLNKTYQSYSDPSHGWLKVSIADLAILNILDQVSKYSYVKNDSVFLEEDQDCNLFFTAMENADIKFDVNHHFTNNSSRIRNYSMYAGI